ncbi:hypothetical protein [Sebaldella sp. S0638]|uniref:hypothetical protein n=1 Tax=Sebaldella sp. S0638 TaxID=2957809 RepID=UPI00209D1B63|nr:hypothetical protein [Sebaldella sp. S0638]MCP1223056.1 hypothetical protein [Sebaldella sp. S0638]
MEIAKAFIEYIRTQKETLNNLKNQNKKDREKMLNEINRNIEGMDLGIKISDLYGEIVFTSVIRDRFKGRILNSFLEKIYGEEYKDEFWEIQEEYENTKYTEINKFFDLLDKVHVYGETVSLGELKDGEVNIGDTENIGDIKNSETSNSETENVHKKSEELSKELYSDLNDFDVIEAPYENINLTEKIEEQKAVIQSSGEYTLSKKSAENKESTENEGNICKINDSKQERENNVSNLQKKPTLESITEEHAQKRIQEKTQIKSSELDNTEFQKFENLKKEVEIKEEKLLKLINETKILIEEKKFYKAVRSLELLVKTDKSAVLNKDKIKYSLEGVLLRVIRFFVPRNTNNREYWEYFTDKYDEKVKFYNNIVRLRKYCGLKPNLENEEYEVKRTD